MKVKSKAKNYQNIVVNTSAGTLTFKDGVTEMTDEQYGKLSDKRFAFMQLSPVDGDALEEQSGEEIKQGEPEGDKIHKEPTKEEEVTPEELIEEEKASNEADSEEVDQELIDQINSTDDVKDLKAVAELLEYPEAEWKSFKGYKQVREYLLNKLGVE